jgi:hypothetical protein
MHAKSALIELPTYLTPLPSPHTPELFNPQLMLPLTAPCVTAYHTGLRSVIFHVNHFELLDLKRHDHTMRGSSVENHNAKVKHQERSSPIGAESIRSLVCSTALTTYANVHGSIGRLRFKFPLHAGFLTAAAACSGYE